ncbi:MAG TPA: diaminopimelate epimerase [Woeseiaceae bacterium]|nr:diaminopimelate epimerase [Woeseiaceae bacterium]
MQIKFFNMQGTGNQIMVVDERNSNRPPPTADQLRFLADPATGPGFDSLMWVMPAKSDSALASYRVFNRDGGEVEQCGNGVRCVARLLAADRSDNGAFALESPAGIIEARILPRDRVSVNMGQPEFRPEHIPFIAEQAANCYEIDVGGEQFEIRVVSMGNPHCVLLVDEPATARVAELGPALERHARFPRRTNVGFLGLCNRAELSLRVWERGVGETLACGTGACAAMVVARRAGWIDATATVNLPGGQLVVSWPRAADSVWLTGAALMISEGTIDL